MKQIALDGKKDPPFGVKMIVWFPVGPDNKSYWMDAYLESIETTEKGKEYCFKRGETVFTDATHYCIPTEPKK